MGRRTAGLAAALSLLAAPTASGAHQTTGDARVPPHVAPAADSGFPRLLGGPRRPEMTAAAVAPAAERVFPVRGRHDLGSEVNGFGGGRGHDGQDVFAACGTPVVAARAGRIVEAATEGNEGHYVVIEAPDGRQQAYLHLLRPSSASRGERVGAGEPIGRVGATGNADGCHLHFELWTAPGRFTGGHALNPRPALDRWASRAEERR